MERTPRQVSAFLEERLGGGVEGVAPLGAGEWSRAYSFRRGGGDYVARFGAYRADFDKDEVAVGFASERLPVPRVIEVGEAFEGYFAISERAFGAMLDSLDGEAMREIVPAVLGMLDATRELDVSRTEGYGLWSPRGVAPHRSWRGFLLAVEHDEPSSRTHGWRARMVASPLGRAALDGFNASVERLRQLVDGCPEERHVIHGDLLNKNVLVEGDRIAAVIDWGNSMYGDFLYDLAWFSFWTHWYRSMDGIDWEAEARRHYDSIGLSVPGFEQRVLACKLHIGLDAQGRTTPSRGVGTSSR